ncbi:septal ring lytic transglycosylase RlpA family protein [Sphingosinicella microcystinivorans]|uniref:septal ring lytic transglycosylase RlpA family protein n=1 Tax=Sphingosinicella microcystinivorans TaxID=335406 RepID=UPI0022F3C9AC|nr:septal ring lytic transglycosylase RlpA family protein [Sphingosinicella microcystinivorans]WBX85392.1 septal ring lytic transglycosylase RlpA family protein [Sphingosinicella microcystinivorans]
MGATLIQIRGRWIRAAAAAATALALCAFSDATTDMTAVSLAEALSATADADDAVFASEAELRLIGSGRASYYADKFDGRRTANGEIFDQDELTAAHRTLPMGSIVKVTCEKTGRSVTVRVNDRGPFTGSRVIDVSKAAARELGMINAGLTDVTLELLPSA